MAIIEVFDPALCCSTGICGVNVDPALVTFAADMAWALEQGFDIKRYNLAQNPRAFANAPAVQAYLLLHGAKSLPVVLVNGEVVLSARYPSREEIATWAQR